MIGFNKIKEVLEVKDEITSKDFYLKDLLDYTPSIHLQIPLYQRLYVWGIEEIKLFIEDICEAFIDNQESYYIGNMMFASKIKDDRVIIDLIDGQQRFTTIWLISIILGKNNQDLRKFAFVNNEPRLKFTSRDEVNIFFKKLQDETINILNNENINFELFDASVEPIVNGITNIYNSIKDIIIKYGWKERELSEFGNYIFNSLLMVQTTVPSKNNLNQIFESLNSGGKQLENHQILKSRLIGMLKKSNFSDDKIDMLVYKWDSSSKMNLYIERSVYSTTSVTWEKTIHPEVWNSGFDSNHSDEYFRLKDYISNDTKSISLLKILQENPDAFENKNNSQDENVRSIIGFSQFLLHTLRVYNLLNGIKDPIPVDSKKLLTFFDISNGEFSSAEKVEKYINLLFELRFLFDKFVIKWTSEEEDNQESLLVNKVYYNKSDKSFSVRREFVEANRQLNLAQSVLYIVQEYKTQYWLTSFMYHLYDKYHQQNIIESYNDSIKAASIFIEKLDNYFYCQINDEETMSNLSFKDYSVIFKDQINGDYLFAEKKLKKLDGTFFSRYWFYKTEYLIWKYRIDFRDLISEAEFEIWDKYKITFKTSIEHIFPQSMNGFESNSDREQYALIKNPILKDYFGNLVLLTVSENSEYGALSPEVKKDKYRSKLENNYIDSLKSSLIFNLVTTSDESKKWTKEKWDFSKAKFHLEEQILLLYQKHLK